MQQTRTARQLIGRLGAALARWRRQNAGGKVLPPALLVGALLLPGGAVAAGYQPLGSIAQAAHDFIAGQIEWSDAFETRIQVGRLDPRLRLPRCDGTLQTYFPAGGRPVGNTSVGVRCSGAAAWSIYVPVTIRLYGPVLVALRPIGRGEQLGADDVQLEERELSGAGFGYFRAPEAAVGMIVKRPIALGAVIVRPMLEEEKLVRRGEKVTLLAATAGAEIRMVGEALDDGAQGELIKVRNTRSRRIVEGRVASPGLVEIRM